MQDQLLVPSPKMPASYKHLRKKDVSVLFSRICTAYGIPLKASVYCNKFETKEGSFRCLLINVKTLRSKNKR